MTSYRGRRLPTRAAGLLVALFIACFTLVHVQGSRAATTHAGPAMTTINLGIALSPPKAVFFGPYVADAEGFFAREHLKANFVSMPNGLEVELGTTTGAIQYGFSSATDAIESAAAGAPIHAIWSYGPKLDTECIGGPSIHKVSDLRGQNVGTTGTGGFAYITLEACLKRGGLTTKDVHLITMTRPAFVPALTTGRIQAAVFHVDDGAVVTKADPKLHVLDVEYKNEPLWWYGGVTARDDFVKTHEDVTRRFLTAMVLADRWMYTHKKAVIKIGVKVSGEDPSAVTKAVNFMIKGRLWTLNRGFSVKSEDFTARTMLKFGDITKLPSYSQVVMAKYIDQVLKKVGKVNEKTFP